MNPETNKNTERRAEIAGLVIAGWLGLILISPVSFMAFPHGKQGLVALERGQWHTVVDPATMVFAEIVGWIVVIFLFARFARELKYRLMLPAALAVIVVTFVAAMLTLRLFGLGADVGFL